MPGKEFGGPQRERRSSVVRHELGSPAEQRKQRKDKGKKGMVCASEGRKEGAVPVSKREEDEDRAHASGGECSG